MLEVKQGRSHMFEP